MDVKKLLHKYSHKFTRSKFEEEEVEQRFYYMLLRRGIIENFDNSVTNLDKVFTSYICSVIKTFCKEEWRFLRKERNRQRLNVTELTDSRGERVSIFDAAQYSWLPGSRIGFSRFSTEGGQQPLVDDAGKSFEGLVADFCAAVTVDQDLSEVERKTFLTLVQTSAYGVSPGDVSITLKCHPPKVSELRKQARNRFDEYKEWGHV